MHTLSVKDVDMHGVVRLVILPSAQRLMAALDSFAKENHDRLPGEVADILSGFLGKFRGCFAAGQSHEHGPLQVIAAMRAVRVEVDFLLSDREIAIRRVVERAFMHLQRTLLADQAARDRWSGNSREEDFERLGSLHLLAHGIWAFKAHGVGGRTDLILGRPIDAEDPQIDNVEAMVLTEWKLARKANEAQTKLDEAHVQLQLYRRGVLGGFELSSRRYAVIVAKENCDLPPDHEIEPGITCRHVCINLAGETPSTVARQSRRRSGR